MRYLLFALFSGFLLSPASAQTDSVVVTGRIRNLSARLYRESPTVLVSCNNILQASRELVRPAPLNADGTFRVALPLIYPLEEMYFNYGRISTAFLASAGTLTIDLDADSLFTAAVPFKFGGVNAQVNGQFARYKAFEATFSDKPNNEKLSKQVEDRTPTETYNLVLPAYQQAFGQFARRERPFPLVTRWVESVNRYNAAGFVYEKATYEGDQLPVSLNDSLRPPDDRLLTAARAAAMNRFADYAVQRASAPELNQRNNGLTVQTLSTLLLRYGRNLTEAERERLQGYLAGNQARSSDLRFFDGLVKRSNDTIQRLVNYQQLIQRSRQVFDSAAVDYITAYRLASALPTLTLDFTGLLYNYARPQLRDSALVRSLDELYRLEVKDSAQIRAAARAVQKAGTALNSTEVSPGVFVTRDAFAGGRALFDQVVNANRGKVIYVLMASPESEEGRQAITDAQRLRSAYSSRDVALVYVPNVGDNAQLWAEFSAKQQLRGDHVLVNLAQLSDVAAYLRPNSELSATVINRVGKITKRNAPLPGAFEEVRKVVEKSL